MNSKAKKKKRQRDRTRKEEKKTSKEQSLLVSPIVQQKKDNKDVDVKKEPLLLQKKKFLSSEDGECFQRHLENYYKGFVHVPVDRLTPFNFHEQAKKAFERLRDAQYYQYDIVMAGGKHASRTFVRRCLVGEPGITYKYLGLRLFAHPWSGPGTPSMMKPIHDINQNMIKMTKSNPNHGLCNYNLTLINYMEPTSHTKVGFKEDAEYGMGKVSVSWHADSSLEDNSSIAVYHCLPKQKKTKWDWKIALRPAPENHEVKNVAPVTVSTADGDVYFLLHTFNQTHQHAVLAGSESNRISSTHRVAVTKQDTYQYILKRVKGAKKHFRLQLENKNLSNLDARVLIVCQRVLTEVECEWISQYWLQGEQHDKLHAWWQHPMKTLETYWQELEEQTFHLYQTCIKNPSSVPYAVRKGFLEELVVRQKQRQLWDERRADKIYQRRISPPFRPVARPIFEERSGTRLEKDLSKIIIDLTETLTHGKKKGSRDTKQGTKLSQFSSSGPDNQRKRAPELNVTDAKSKTNKKKRRKST